MSKYVHTKFLSNFIKIEKKSIINEKVFLTTDLNDTLSREFNENFSWVDNKSPSLIKRLTVFSKNKRTILSKSKIINFKKQSFNIEMNEKQKQFQSAKQKIKSTKFY